MEAKLTNKSTDIEQEMQRLRDGFNALKAKREALQKKIDDFKKRSA